MKSGAYWKQRFRQMEEAQNDKSMKKVMEIQEQFDKSLATIDGKINAWYQRLASNNGVSMQEARRMLSEKELKEFKWSVEEYIKYAEENEISGAWVKQLENASARVHISRLEALKIEVQQEAEKLYGNSIDDIDGHIRGIYANEFYHTAYEIQKGIGIGVGMLSLDQNLVEKIVCKPWAVDGKNFSDRLWENKTKLVNSLHNSLSRMAITGEAPDRVIDEIAKQMNVSRVQAGRIVMTESAAFANAARQDCMKNLGVEEFEVIVTLDSHTCENCGDVDGKHYPMKDFLIGVTAPPFHPFCRCSTCPYFDDEFTIGEERAARDADGNVYYVPADTTYNEWKKGFVGVDKSGFKKQNAAKNTDQDLKTDNRYEKVKNKLLSEARPNSNDIIDALEYSHQGVTYKVDNKNVVLDYSEREKQIAEIYERTFGGVIMMVPRVLNPKGISTPDYLIDNKKFDLKELHGQSKNLVYNAVAKKKRQADNFILDITDCPLSEDEIDRQIDELFNRSTHASFVNSIVVVNGDEIIEVYERKKE